MQFFHEKRYKNFVVIKESTISKVEGEGADQLQAPRILKTFFSLTCKVSKF